LRGVPAGRVSVETEGSAEGEGLPLPRNPHSNSSQTLAKTQVSGHSRGMADRYVIRKDPSGFTVADNFTGEPLVLAMEAQKGLTEEDAEHLAALFNKRAEQGDRALLQ
jgi:hypothetical protein